MYVIANTTLAMEYGADINRPSTNVFSQPDTVKQPAKLVQGVYSHGKLLRQTSEQTAAGR